MMSRLIIHLDLSRVCILPPPLPQNGLSSSSCTLRKDARRARRQTLT